MRILVVEDEEKLASIIACGLKAEGFSVDTVSNAGDGIALAPRQSFRPHDSRPAAAGFSGNDPAAPRS